MALSAQMGGVAEATGQGSDQQSDASGKSGLTTTLLEKVYSPWIMIPNAIFMALYGTWMLGIGFTYQKIDCAGSPSLSAFAACYGVYLLATLAVSLALRYMMYVKAPNAVLGIFNVISSILNCVGFGFFIWGAVCIWHSDMWPRMGSLTGKAQEDVCNKTLYYGTAIPLIIQLALSGLFMVFACCAACVVIATGDTLVGGATGQPQADRRAVDLKPYDGVYNESPEAEERRTLELLAMMQHLAQERQAMELAAARRAAAGAGGSGARPTGGTASTAVDVRRAEAAAPAGARSAAPSAQDGDPVRD